jgi:hypothetical protein
VCVADEPTGGVGIVVELLEGHAEIHPEREQPLLRTVVQVALDLAAIGHRDVDAARLRRAQRGDTARAQAPARDGAVDVREAADDPRHEREDDQAGDGHGDDLVPGVESLA